MLFCFIIFLEVFFLTLRAEILVICPFNGKESAPSMQVKMTSLFLLKIIISKFRENSPFSPEVQGFYLMVNNGQFGFDIVL